MRVARLDPPFVTRTGRVVREIRQADPEASRVTRCFGYWTFDIEGEIVALPERQVRLVDVADDGGSS